MTLPDSPRLLAIAALGLVIVGNAVGSILLKLSADSAKRGVAVFGLINVQFVLGVACFGMGLLAYSWALRHFQLHVAQIVLSLQYVLAILLAGWILREDVDLTQWSGILLIGIGLYLCAR